MSKEAPSERRGPNLVPLRTDESERLRLSQGLSSSGPFSGAIAVEVGEDFGGVAFGADDGPDDFDFPGFADEER